MVDRITGEVVTRVPTDIDVGDSFWSADVIENMLVVVTSGGDAEGFLPSP